MKTKCVIHWIENYPINSAVYLLNDLGLINSFVILSSGPVTISEDCYQRFTK